MHPSPSSSERAILIALLIAILALAAALRFADIGAESYWLDEIIMVHLTSGSYDAMVQELQAMDRPPVYILLGYAWSRLFGTSEAATRSLSALAGVGSIFVVYFVGKELYCRQVGVLAALIMALSAFQIWYSQEYRYYAVFQFVTLLAAFFYLMWLRYDYRLDLIAYVIASALAVYVQTYAVFFYVGLGLHFLTQWRTASAGKRLIWIGAQLAIIIAVAPRVLHALTGLSGGDAGTPTFGGGTAVIDWVPVPPFYAPLRTLGNFVFLQRDSVSWAIYGIAAAVFVIGVLAVARRRDGRRDGRRDRRRDRRRGTTWIAGVRAAIRSLIRLPDSNLTLLLLWLVAPISMVFLISLVFAPIYVDRFLISTAPACYVLIAATMWTLRRVIPLALSLGTLLILLVTALTTYYTDSLKEQWRETAAYVQQNIAPGDVIALSYGNFPGDAFNIHDSFSWYYPYVSSDCYVDVRSDQMEAQMAACSATGERLWLVVYTANPGGERLTLERQPEHYTLTNSRDFIGTSVYLFDRNP